MITSAIILAGGLGTRLRSVVADVPKPMAPVNGKPFLEYLLDYWYNQGIFHFVISVGYRHEIITSHFGARYKNATIEYAIEKTPLGTGGGFLLASDHLGDDSAFLLLNGDTYFPINLAALERFAQSRKADWCFSLFQTHDTNRYMAMEMTTEGKIVSLRRKGQGLANGGVYWVNRTILKDFPNRMEKISLEDEILEQLLIKRNNIYGTEFQESFLDIGIPQDYYRATDLLKV